MIYYNVCGLDTFKEGHHVSFLFSSFKKFKETIFIYFFLNFDIAFLLCYGFIIDLRVSAKENGKTLFNILPIIDQIIA